MRKLYVVKRSEDFDDIINNYPFKKYGSFIIYYKGNELKYDRYGISVGKKIGNAVTRNTYKRKIRAIIDNYKKNYNNQQDYIIILRRSALDKTYQELESEFNKAMHLIRKEYCNEEK